MIKSILLTSSLAFIAILSGCAAIQSKVSTVGEPVRDGLIYYVPRRPFVVTVQMPATPSPTLAIVTVGPGAAEPDLKHQFVLSQGSDPVAKTEMNISVGANGLLKSSNTTATSEVATAVGSVASFAGLIVGGLPAPIAGANADIIGKGNAPKQRKNGCPVAGSSYQYLIYPEKDQTSDFSDFCGYSISWVSQIKDSIDKQKSATGDVRKDNLRSEDHTTSHSGIFYRQELPYIVTVTGPTVAADNKTAIIPTVSRFSVSSPDESSIGFMPITKIFFASNTANITLADGELTGIDQTSESEVTAALSLPATVLNNYMSAIGSAFTSRKTNLSDLQGLLAQQRALAAAQVQSAICSKTITANPINGLTGAQLQSALAAIQAACPSTP